MAACVVGGALELPTTTKTGLTPIEARSLTGASNCAGSFEVNMKKRAVLAPLSRTFARSAPVNGRETLTPGSEAAWAAVAGSATAATVRRVRRRILDIFLLIDPAYGALEVIGRTPRATPRGTMADLAPGDVFAGHRIEAVAGRGGMGVVYRAVHLALERVVALKLIAPAFAGEPDFRARFVRESRAAASIEHPNVIPIFSAGSEQDVLYISMRFVDGQDLRSAIQAAGSLEPRRAARIVAQV